MSTFEPYEEDVPEIMEIDGFKRGDAVRVLEDNEEEGYFEGDEGVVCGFGRIDAASTFSAAATRALFGSSAASRDYMMVRFPARDPVEVRPDDLEQV